MSLKHKVKLYQFMRLLNGALLAILTTMMCSYHPVAWPD